MTALPSPLKFAHGVHPPDFKELSKDVPTRRLPFPDEVVLPLSQHAGPPARLVVAKGDRVERGDQVGQGIFGEFGQVPSASIHASASGTIKEIARWPKPDGSWTEAVRIEVDPYSPQVPRPRLIPDWETLDRLELIYAIRDGGVVGLGGAAFPTYFKLLDLQVKKNKAGKVTGADIQPLSVDYLLINGCECEPYLTTDHRTMVEFPGRVHLGARILQKCLGAKKILIGVERNKPDAIEALQKTLPADIDVEVLPLRVRYPQGAEKMLIKALVDREVPSGGLPKDAGVVVQNVASAATIAEIFETGLPLIERIVTVTGPGVRRPANFIVPVGTKLRYLLEACGGLTDDAREIVFGGPMMGQAQGNLDTPILKGTSGVVVLTEREVGPRPQYPCVRCGACLDACPVFLNPQRLGVLAKSRRYDEMPGFHLMDCMLCGCCSYVCPSGIPLAQLFSVAKTALRR